MATAKPKNQTELTEAFLSGAISGKVGHLLIQQDTLYNTEYNEYLPVVRRVNPPEYDTQGDILSRILIVINESWYEYKHESYRQHKQKALDISKERKDIVTYMVMKTYSKPYDQHPLDPEDAKSNVRHYTELATKHHKKIKHIEDHTYNRLDYEQNSTDAELIEAFTQLADEFILTANYIQADLEDAEFKAQIKNIEELVRAPQIMEQAIKNGGIDPAQLQRMLKTRDQVKEMIEHVEQHISIILDIPGPAVPGQTEEN